MCSAWASAWGRRGRDRRWNLTPDVRSGPRQEPTPCGVTRPRARDCAAVGVDVVEVGAIGVARLGAG